MRRQRQAKPEHFRSRTKRLYWSPLVIQEGREVKLVDVGTKDWYAVVDEIIEGVVRLEIAAWPELDRGGHLRFASMYEQSYPLDRLQRLADRARKKHRQPAPDRPLRIGDAFRIRSTTRPGMNLVSGRFRGTIQDISDAARRQAKIAMHGAVAHRIKPTVARARQKESQKAGRFPRTERSAQDAQGLRLRSGIFEWED